MVSYRVCGPQFLMEGHEFDSRGFLLRVKVDWAVTEDTEKMSWSKRGAPCSSESRFPHVPVEGECQPPKQNVAVDRSNSGHKDG